MIELFTDHEKNVLAALSKLRSPFFKGKIRVKFFLETVHVYADLVDHWKKIFQIEQNICLSCFTLRQKSIKEWFSFPATDCDGKYSAKY